MQSAHRSGDAVITVCQDNRSRSLEIKDVNDSFVESLGFKSEDTVGKDLVDILPARISDTVKEYVEFTHNGKDLAEVLSKVRQLSMPDRQGHEKQFRLKIIRSDAQDHRAWFRLILQDERSLRGVEVFKDMLQENLKGHEVLDEETGLPNKYSLQKDLELVGYHASSKGMNACFAVVQVDDYDKLLSKYGRPACIKLMKEVAALCKQNLRSEDTVGSLDYNELGIILVGIEMEPARVALNRLRWLIASSKFDLRPAGGVPITVSISFSRVASNVAEKELVATLEQSLDAARTKGGNTILEIAA